jgi:hypothetical protein
MTEVYYIDDRERKTITNFQPFTFIDKLFSK